METSETQVGSHLLRKALGEELGGEENKSNGERAKEHRYMKGGECTLFIVRRASRSMGVAGIPKTGIEELTNRRSVFLSPRRMTGSRIILPQP